jgi:hypothetical protein
MIFLNLIMDVLLIIKICSYKGPNAFFTTQQDISNKKSHFFDIYEEVEKLGDNEFGRTDKANESIALFLDEMKNRCDNDYAEQNIFENLPRIIDLDGHVLRKTADIMIAYIQEKTMMREED